MRHTISKLSFFIIRAYSANREVENISGSEYWLVERVPNLLHACVKLFTLCLLLTLTSNFSLWILADEAELFRPIVSSDDRLHAF